MSTSHRGVLRAALRVPRLPRAMGGPAEVMWWSRRASSADQPVMELLRMVPFLHNGALPLGLSRSVRWPARHGAAPPGPVKGTSYSNGDGGTLAFFGPRVPSASPGLLLSWSPPPHPADGLP